MTVTDLHTGWTVRAIGGDVPADLRDVAVPATVPGCVHLDLLAAGLIPDPYLADNESALLWIGAVDWRYECEFEYDGGAAEHVDLVARGLDTVARIAVNDVVVADTANMHRTYRLPVRRHLRVGINRLSVTFSAGRQAAEAGSQLLGPRPHVNTHPFNGIRKMAANYGWDWGPDVVTAGIWRPLQLHAWTGARIAEVRPLVAVEGTTGRLTAHVRVEGDADVQAVVGVAGRSAPVVDGVAVIEIPDVELWWPAGEGEQERYDVFVRLGEATEPLDEWHARIGFRTIEIDTAPDADGTPFTVIVNGRRLFMRGVNWIPDDCFPSRIGRDRYARRLAQAADMNVNLVRVWGGGIYESDDFYEVCDELGLLVWQDFLFACAAYAEEEPLRAEVVAEARDNIARLSPHPSLAIWNGCNENIWGFHDWDWQEPLAGRSWGWGYYTQVLPGLLAELDPTRPYSPGSPFAFRDGVHPNDPAHGTMHIWDVWNERDYSVYREYRPRFVAEFGFQGPPAWTTLTRAVPEAELRPDSPTMLVHQKAEDGNGKLTRGLEPHLPLPDRMDDWHWAMSLNQARAMGVGVEHLRSLAPLCAGAVVWQLNDCWPVTSWAAVDGDGRRKPLWYALRRSFAPRLLTIQPRDGGLVLVAVNDAGEPWRGEVGVSRRRVDGTVVARHVAVLDVAPRTASTVELPHSVAVAQDPARELVLAEVGGMRAWWHFVEDRDADFAPASVDAKVDDTAGGYRVTVVAHTLVRDLALLADRAAPDAEVDDMLITLLPGESATFVVTTSARLRAEQLTDPLVLRCANQLLER